MHGIAGEVLVGLGSVGDWLDDGLLTNKGSVYHTIGRNSKDVLFREIREMRRRKKKGISIFIRPKILLVREGHCY